MTLSLRGDATVDEILDAGAISLHYFAEFLPRAQKFAPQRATYEQLRVHYDQQRGMNLHTLEEDAGILARALSDSDAQFEAQQRQVGSLPASWTGAAAEATARSLDEHLRRAREGMSTARNVHGAMVGAGSCLRELVARKADAIAGLHQETVGGRSPEEIDAIIAGATLCPGGNPTGLLRRLVDYFPDLDAVLPSKEQVAPVLGDSALEAVVDRCRTWLAEVFLPHVTASVETFLMICSATDQAVTAVYDELTKAFSAIDESGLPGTPVTAPPGPLGTEWVPGHARSPKSGALQCSSEGNSDLGAVPAFVHAPTPVDIPGVGVSTEHAPGKDIAAAVCELADAVLELSTTAVTEVTELLGNGPPHDALGPDAVLGPAPRGAALSAAVESHQDGAALPEAVVERPSSSPVGGPVEFEVAGRTLRIEPALGCDGVAITVVGEDQVLRAFDFTFDENGMPKLTEVEVTSPEEAVDQQPSAESAGPAPPDDTEDAPRIGVVPSPALPAPAPHVQQSEEVMMTPPTDEPVTDEPDGIGDEGISDTGVVLAEAGPL